MADPQTGTIFDDIHRERQTGTVFDQIHAERQATAAPPADVRPTVSIPLTSGGKTLGTPGLDEGKEMGKGAKLVTSPLRFFAHGAEQTGQGLSQMEKSMAIDPTTGYHYTQNGGNFAGGLADTAMGAGTLALPFAFPGIVAHPLKALKGLIAGTAVGKTAEVGSGLVGVDDPGYRKLIGTGAGFAGGLVPGLIEGSQVPTTTESGIPLSFAERQPGSWWRAPFEKFIENRSTGRGPQAQFRQGQAAKAADVASKVGEGMAPPHTAEEAGMGAGDVIRTGLEARQSALDAQTEAGNAARIAQAEAENAKAQSDFVSNQKAAAAQLEANRTAGAAKVAKEEANFYQLADSLGPSAAPEAYGTTVQRAARTAFDAFKTKAGDLFGTVDQLVGRPSIPTNGIKRVVAGLRAELIGTGGIIGSDEATKTIAMLDNMLGRRDETGQIVSGLEDTAGFKQLQIIRSEMMRQLRKVDSLLPGRYAGAEKLLTQAFTDAMEQGAAQGGGPKAVTALREANNFYRTNAPTFNEGIVPDVLDANPEHVGRLVWRPGSVTEPRALLNLIQNDPAAVAALRRSGLDAIIQKATNNSGELNGKIIAREIRRMGETGKLLFGDHPEQFINQASKVDVAQQEAAALAKSKLPGDKFTPQMPELLKPPEAPKTKAEVALLNITDRAPQLMPRKLFIDGGGDISLIRAARRHLTSDPDLWDGLRRAAWEQMVDMAMRKPSNLGGRAFDSGKFADFWSQMSPQVQEVLAGSAEQLKRINNIMGEMQQVDTSKAIKLRIPATGFVEPAALLTGAATGNAGPIAGVGGSLTFARIVSNMMVNSGKGAAARASTPAWPGMGLTGYSLFTPPSMTPPPDQPR